MQRFASLHRRAGHRPGDAGGEPRVSGDSLAAEQAPHEKRLLNASVVVSSRAVRLAEGNCRRGVPDLGVLPEDAWLRLRFWSAEPARLLILLGLHRADGGFGGNFEVNLSRGAGTLQEDGWREVSVPLDQFHALVDRKPRRCPQTTWWRCLRLDSRARSSA